MGFMGAHYRGSAYGRRDPGDRALAGSRGASANARQARGPAGRKRVSESPGVTIHPPRAGGAPEVTPVDTRSATAWTEAGQDPEHLRQSQRGDLAAALEIFGTHRLPLRRTCLVLTQHPREAAR